MAICDIRLFLHDGKGRNFTAAETLVTIVNGRSKTLRSGFFRSSSIVFRDLEFADGPENDFRVIASAKDHQQTGAFVRVRPGQAADVALMLIPKNPVVELACPDFASLERIAPEIAKKLSASDKSAAYEAAFRADSGLSLMCMFNCLECLHRLGDKLNTTMLDFLESIELVQTAGSDRRGLRRDRIFVKVQKTLRSFIDGAQNRDAIAPVPLDPDDNFKEKRFAEANLELTFHPGDVLEVDMDYYRDPMGHFFLEFIPHFVGRDLLRRPEVATDPRVAYSLRWMAAMGAGERFEPLVTITPG